MISHEEAIIRSFIKPAKRDRFLALLSSKKRRSKALDTLNHLHDLDERCAVELPSASDVEEELKKRGAPDTCYLISDCSEIDGREMLLSEALSKMEIEGWGTLIGCIPGRLAYYYGEQGEQRLILEKSS